MSEKIIIRKVYQNPRHTVCEDFSLIPSCTETEGYEDLETIMRKLVSHKPIRSSLRPLSDGKDLRDEAIEDVFAKVSEQESVILSNMNGNKSSGVEEVQNSRASAKDFCTSETKQSADSDSKQTSDNAN